MEERPPVLGAPVPGGADAAEVRAQPGAAAARDDEPGAVVHMLVEQQRVGAADEIDIVAADELEELLLADGEAPLGVRREAPAEARGRVHEDDDVRLNGGLQCLCEERQRVPARSGGACGRVDHGLPLLARRRVDRDEPGVAVAELEVHRPVHLRPRLSPAGVVEVVVAGDADVRERQLVRHPQVVLVALARPRPGEVAEVGEEQRRGP